MFYPQPSRLDTDDIYVARTRRYDSKPFHPKTEKEVFDLFGLEWVDPTLRNADV